MTSRDYSDIKNLHYIHRFIPSSIARLYQVSHVTILNVLKGDKYIISDIECLLCGLEEIIEPYFIDGNEDNHSPQNVLMLCEAHKRRFKHLKRRS